MIGIHFLRMTKITSARRRILSFSKTAKNIFAAKCIQIAFPRVVLASAQSADTNDYFEEFFL